jgi:hypothetical protein
MGIMENKKFVTYFIIVVIIAVIFAGILYLREKKEAIPKKETISDEAIEREALVKQQIEELETFRQDTKIRSFLEKDIKRQVEELDKLRFQ